MQLTSETKQQDYKQLVNINKYIKFPSLRNISPTTAALHLERLCYSLATTLALAISAPRSRWAMAQVLESQVAEDFHCNTLQKDDH